MDTLQWPVIYVFRSADWKSVSDLDLPAERPRRQEAYFIQGSWGPHANACADDLIAVLRLAPELGAAEASTAWLFPGPSEDPFFNELLDWKTNLGSHHPVYEAAGLEHVFELRD
jgi:hypothetical protein